MADGLSAAVYARIAARNERLLAQLAERRQRDVDVKQLETLWHQLKFVVLEGDPSAYFQIREGFNQFRAGERTEDDLQAFVFERFEHALRSTMHEKNVINVLTHVWGFLGKRVGEAARAQVLPLIAQLSDGDLSVAEELYDRFGALYRTLGRENLLDPVL